MIAPRRWTVAQAEPLMDFLLGTLSLKRADAKRYLKFGAVQVNGIVVRRFDHALMPGNEVCITDSRGAAARGRLTQARVQILHEDDALIVVEKPSGLLTVATDRQKDDTLFLRVNDYLRSRCSASASRAWVVHRLDQETSGLVLFAKTDAVKQSLQTNWPEVQKTYLAIVHGRPAADSGTVTSYLSEDEKSLRVSSSDRPRPGAQRAITHYRVIESRCGRSLVEVRLETGRKHQIRVHLAELRCPVLGDRRYAEKTLRVRLALHASELRFAHPLTGEMVGCRSPLPRALRKLLS